MNAAPKDKAPGEIIQSLGVVKARLVAGMIVGAHKATQQIALRKTGRQVF